MTLSEWLKSNGTTRADFAARVGVTTSTICRLLPNDKRSKRQRRKPSVDLVARIVRETDGAVTEREVIAEALLDCAGAVGPQPETRVA